MPSALAMERLSQLLLSVVIQLKPHAWRRALQSSSVKVPLRLQRLEDGQDLSLPSEEQFSRPGRGPTPPDK